MRALAPLRVAVSGTGQHLCCTWARPFATDPSIEDDAFTSAAWEVVVAGGPVGRTRVGLGGDRSRCSCVLRVVRVARAFVSGHPQPGRAQRGRPDTPQRPSYPSRIRVERAATRGAAGRGGSPPRPARRRGRYALPARHGRSEHHRGRVGGIKVSQHKGARRGHVRRF